MLDKILLAILLYVLRFLAYIFDSTLIFATISAKIFFKESSISYPTQSFSLYIFFSLINESKSSLTHAPISFKLIAITKQLTIIVMMT